VPLFFVMTNAKGILTEQIETLAAPVLAEHQAELVDLQFVHEHGQWVLRFFLDKGGGISLDDCAKISDHLGRTLDAADLIPQHYSLEVSSPGINRPLKKESDYRRFIGERIDLTVYAPVNGRRHFRGTIHAVGTGTVTVEESPEQSYTLALADVAKARLDPEIRI
jgi:ribosome maturation factor RimP